jgi:hypothetical protein
MARQKLYPLNSVEAKDLKAAVYDLTELAAKQILYGMIQILSMKNRIIRDQFEEILDDARKYSELKKQSNQ